MACGKDFKKFTYLIFYSQRDFELTKFLRL